MLMLYVPLKALVGTIPAFKALASTLAPGPITILEESTEIIPVEVYRSSGKSGTCVNLRD